MKYPILEALRLGIFLLFIVQVARGLWVWVGIDAVLILALDYYIDFGTPPDYK